MMKNRVEQIQGFLTAFVAPVIDIDDEQAFLQALHAAQREKIVMVTGPQSGDPLSLLSGLGVGSALPERMAAAFPVKCVYGAELSITVETTDGSRSVFYKPDDLQRHFDNRWDEVTMLQVAAPAEVLRQTSLLFYTMDADKSTLERCAACSHGFILTLGAAAGAPGDALMDFCDWVDQKLNRKDCIAAVLNHAERTLRVNKNLQRAMSDLVGGNAAVLTCRHGGAGNDTPEAVLLKAAAAVLPMERAAQEASKEAIEGAIERVEERIRQHCAEQIALAERCEGEEQRWRRAAKTCKDEAFLDRYQLADLLTDQEKNHLHEELAGIAMCLDSALPQLADELLKCSDDPKADMGNLCGEYIEAVLEGFLSALIDDLTNTTLVPRAVSVFDATQGRLSLLVRDVPLHELGESSYESVEVEFLNTLHLNVGQLGTRLSATLGQLTRWAVWLFMFAIDLGYLGHGVSKTVGVMVNKVVNAVTPPKLFVQDCLDKIHEKMPPTQLADSLYQTMCDSLLPLISHRLEEAYDRMVNDYIAAITDRADSLKEKAKSHRQEAAHGEQLLEQMKTM